MSQLRSYQRNVSRLISTDIESTDKLCVDFETAKSYAKIDSGEEDAIVDVLAESARKEFENYTGKLLFIRAITTVFECEGESLLILPYKPIVSVTSVQKDGEDVEYELKGDRIKVTAVGEVEVVYQCGLFEDEVDSEAQLGLYKYITSNYEDRQDVAGIGVYEMPNSSKKHWLKYKNFSL